MSSSSSETSISSLFLDPSSGDSDGASACGDACCRNADKPADFEAVEAEDFQDVLIIGAGPNGLAVVSRLRERHPPSIYTDLEQARIRWLGGKLHTKVKGNQRKLVQRASSRAPKSSPKINVLDASAPEWMQTWQNVRRGPSLLLSQPSH